MTLWISTDDHLPCLLHLQGNELYNHPLLQLSDRQKTGVRQGCLLSPFLFLLAIDFIMKTTTTGRNNSIQCRIWTQLGDLNFADDLALLSHNYSQMHDKTTRLEITAAETGLLKEKQEKDRADEDQYHCQHADTSHSRWRAHQRGGILCLPEKCGRLAD
jgi:hypothetical protein